MLHTLPIGPRAPTLPTRDEQIQSFNNFRAARAGRLPSLLVENTQGNSVGEGSIFHSSHRSRKSRARFPPPMGATRGLGLASSRGDGAGVHSAHAAARPDSARARVRLWAPHGNAGLASFRCSPPPAGASERLRGSAGQPGLFFRRAEKAALLPVLLRTQALTCRSESDHLITC